MAKKILPNSLARSSSLQPRSRLLVRHREERIRHTSPIDNKIRTPLVVLRRGGSRRCRLQEVVLRLQAHVSFFSLNISLLSYSPVSPWISLCSFSLPISLLSLPISLCSLSWSPSALSQGERTKIEREQRNWKGEREIEGKILERVKDTGGILNSIL